MSRFDLTGRVAVVTGALGRLGPVWTHALLEAGARVVALDRPDAPVPDAFRALERGVFAARLELARADVRDRTALEAVRARLREAGLVATTLVNNAGIDAPPSVVRTFRLEDVPFEVSREVLDVNTLGAMQVMQVFGEDMVRLRRGAIVNIGSLYAEVSPDPRFYDHVPTDPPFLKPPAYGASKAALVSLTRYFATHWAPYGVRVNALSPGGVLGSQDEPFKAKFTARVPMGRMASLDDLGGPLVFLVSDGAAYVTGINLVVDGGFTAW